MIVKFEYRDKQNWEKEVTGDVVDWTNYSKKYVNDIVQPYYVRPLDVSDTWNGKESTVQQTNWTAFYVEFYIQENGINFVQQLSSCSDIVITQITQDSNGNNLETVYNDIDLVLATNLEISEPERVDITSSWKVSIIFRTGRTIIDKAIPIDLTNNIIFTKSSPTWELRFSAEAIPGKIDGINGKYIFSLDGQSIKRFKRVGDSWVLKESGTISQANTSYGGDITALSETSVAIVADGVSGFLVQYDISNGTFAQVGNALAGVIGGFTQVEIASFSATRIALYGRDNPGAPFNFTTLKAYDTDGTDWSQTGNTYSRNEDTFCDLCKMTSSKIAVANADTDVLTSYDFDGTDFTIDDDLSVTIGNTPKLARLEDNRVALIQSQADLLSGFILSGTWSQESSVSISMSTFAQIASVSKEEVYISSYDDQTNISGNYDYGERTYYTDFDILDWAKVTEDIFSEWKGDPDTIIQSISKTGYESVFYLNTEFFDQFLAALKDSNNTLINSIVVTEVENEPSIIGENYYKIIVRGVSDKTIINKGESVNNTFPLLMNSNTYYTDFTIEVNEKNVENVSIDWFDGTQKLAQSTYKKTWAMVFFLTGGALDNIQEDFRVSQIKTLNGQATQEAEMATELVGENYYKVIITGVISTTRVNHNMSPNNDYSLLVNGNTYFTDYIPKLIPEQGEIDTYENQTGINSTSKSISKTVRQLRFFLNETDSEQLRQDFELDGQNAVISPGAINVLENRTPERNELGTSSDLYEVVVNCLTAATIL